MQASRRRCRGWALPTDGHPQSWLQERWASQATAVGLPHTQPAAQEAELWDHKRKRAAGPTDPAIFPCFHSLSLSPPAKPAIEHSTSQIPAGKGGL